MKSLSICVPICNFAGEPVKDNLQTREDKTVYMKDLLMQYVGQLFGANNKEKALLAYRVAQKIYDHTEDPLELEDAEFAIVQEAVKVPKHGPMWIVPIYQALADAEKKEM